MAKYAASPGIEAISIDNVDLAGAVGVGQEFAIIIPNHGTPNITWQSVLSAAVASITILLEASLDGTNWFTIDSSSSVTGEIRTIAGTYKFLRANNTAVAGGAGITLDVSFVYSNTTANPVSDGFPTLQRAKIVVTTAEVLNLFSARKVLILGVPNKFIIPEQSLLVKQPGTAYNIASVTSFSCGWSGVTNPGWGGLGLNDSQPFFEDAATRVLLLKGMFSRSGVVQTTINPRIVATALIGASIDLFTLGGNPTAGIGNINCYITYRIWEEADLNW